MTASLRAVAMLCLLSAAALAQVIEFENGGQKYQTLTKQGVTIMFSRMPSHLRDYGMLQVAISNGSDRYWTIKPQEFSLVLADGRQINAAPAADVVRTLLDRGTHGDLAKLVSTYEAALYAIPNMNVTNGYEQRRRAAITGDRFARLTAAAAASAVALVDTRLGPRQSTDGAIFIPAESKQSLSGKLVVRTNGLVFEFNPD